MMASPATSPDGGKSTSALWREEGLKSELRDAQRQLQALQAMLETTRAEREEQRNRADELDFERQRACDELDVAQQAAKRLETELDTLAKQHEDLIAAAAQSKAEADEARKVQRLGELEKERLEDALAKEREQVMVFECEMEEMKKKVLDMGKEEEKQRKTARNNELEKLQQTIRMQGEEVERLQKLRAEERKTSEDLLEQMAMLRLTTPRHVSGLEEGEAEGQERESGSERDDVSSVGSSLPFTPRQGHPAGAGFRTKLNLSELMGEGGGAVEATPRTSQAAEMALVALDDMEQELRAAGRLAEERGEEVQHLTARLLQEQRRAMSLQKQLAKAALGHPLQQGPEYVSELERELAEARARVTELEEEGQQITEEVERALEVMETEVAEAKAGRDRAERAGRELEAELQELHRTAALPSPAHHPAPAPDLADDPDQAPPLPRGAEGGGMEEELERVERQLAELERVLGQLRRRAGGLAAGGSLWDHPEAARLLEENSELANRCLLLISQSSAASARVKELERKGQEWSREVEALEGKLSSLSATLDVRDQQVEDLEQAVENANGKVDMMAAQMAAMHEYLYARRDPDHPDHHAPASPPYQPSPSKGGRRGREQELQGQLEAALGRVAVLEEQAAKEREHGRSALVDFMRDFGSSGGEGAVETQALQQEVHGLRALLREKEAVMERLAVRARGKKHKDWWRRMF